MAKLSENAQLIAEKRYFQEGEDWDACCARVARVISQFETDKTKYERDFYEVINNLYFLPGGRILRNSGRPRGSLFNCYVLGIGDSRKSIGQFYSDSLQLWGSGGGVGCNYSTLRPRGAEIKGVGGYSSGAVSFLKASDAIAKTVESGGSRRAAALGLLLVSHPDIEEFIDAKVIDKELPHYNISVGITEAFLDAVEADAEWELSFAQQVYKKVSARDLWNKILENNLKYAEPGLINWDNLRSNNSYYFSPPTCTNPCGETTLSPYESCDLGSVVLKNFVSPGGNTNWKRMEEVISLAVRFLDNVIDINQYDLSEVATATHNSRRIGVGIMGLADYFFLKKIRYGSKKSLEELDKLMKFIRDCVYTNLIKLSSEKGSFPKFEAVPYSKAHFIRTLPPSLRLDIKNFGVRCVTGLAIAPTGSISLIADTTSGIEPLFRKAYRRSDRVSERIYVHPYYEDIINKTTEMPDWFVDSSELKPEEHLSVQSTCQLRVDNSISKTINLPASISVSEISSLLLETLRDLKGVTLYVDGSREGQILNSITHDEVVEFIKKDKHSTALSEKDVACASGACEI